MATDPTNGTTSVSQPPPIPAPRGGLPSPRPEVKAPVPPTLPQYPVKRPVEPQASPAPVVKPPEAVSLPTKSTEDGLELPAVVRAIQSDRLELASEIEQAERKILELRQQVVQHSRRNFILERELAEIDEKIKLLINYHVNVNEVLQMEDKANSEQTPLKGKVALYQELFYLLQSRPKYFAALTRVIPAKDVPVFVQTVVFDMYGDQYDTREERLLLTLFRMVLKDELDQCTDKGSLMRANTALTQMLSAYARRGQGLSILREILEEPLQNIINDKTVNFEIDPSKVWQQVIADEETNTGKASTLNRNASEAEILANPEVAKILEARQKSLMHHADVLLQRIMAAADNIPYGMRWICKQLGELSSKRFPDIDKYQIGSLMGGYIYLRFFNPVIVAPDASNLISSKPSRIGRRNLILVAKVLQNLSNGLLFGDKEAFMKSVNAFIQNSLDPLQAYFERLTRIHDLEETMQLDRYTEGTGARANEITISYNQIFLIHSLLEKHLKGVVGEEKDDPIIEVLQRLGPAPPQVDKALNRSIVLQLRDTGKTTRLSTADLMDGLPPEEKENPLLTQTRQLAVSVLRKLPVPSGPAAQQSIIGYLRQQQSESSDAALKDQLGSLINSVKMLSTMKLIPQGENEDATANAFIEELAQDALTRRQRLEAQGRKQALIAQALKTINNHYDYLNGRLEMYKVYLENARKGQAQGNLLSDKKKAPKEAKMMSKKFTHEKLAEQGLIAKVHPDVAGVIKSCYYLFTMDSPGKFKVEVHLKKGIDISLLKKPIELVLEDLLHKQEHGQVNLDFDYLSLNVNLLIHLLNHYFVQGKS